jgi:inner membrane protein
MLAMATPIGHSLAGYAVYRFSAPTADADRVHLACLCILLSVAPDLDFLPGVLMGQPALYHQGVSHSLGFALLVSLTLAGIYTLRGWAFSTIFQLSFFAYASHLALDFFGPDGRPPYGIPLLWPLSMEYFISPVPLLLGVRHVHSTSASIREWVDGIFVLYNAGAILLEITLVTPFVWAARRYRLRCSKQAGGASLC